MGLDFFEKKRKLFGSIMDAVEVLRQLAPELADDERQALLSGLNDVLGETPDIAVPVGKTLFDSPATAVRALLAANPVGLQAQEIVNTLLSRIQTASSDPKSVLYSAIAYLKKEGEIEQLEDKIYRLKPKVSQNP